MSRIGKQPVAIPTGITVEIKGSEVVIKGSKGSLTQQIPLGIEIKVEDGKVIVSRKVDTRQARAFHGLTRALIANMVKGLTDGYKKVLEISGVGYRANLQGKTLNLSLGFSHPINYPVPNGVEVKV